MDQGRRGEGACQHQLGIQQAWETPASTLTFAEAVARYLEPKARKGSLKDERHRLERLKAAFGAATPLLAITASKISEHKVPPRRQLATEPD